jgi:hypothetical protein
LTWVKDSADRNDTNKQGEAVRSGPANLRERGRKAAMAAWFKSLTAAADRNQTGYPVKG